MNYRFLQSNEFNDVRSSLLSDDELSDLLRCDEQSLLPVGRLSELRPDRARLLMDATVPVDSHGLPLVTYNLAVRKQIQYEQYQRIEDRFLRVATQFFRQAGNYFVAQVAYGLVRPSRELKLFFTNVEVRQVESLFSAVKARCRIERHLNVIESGDEGLFVLLMRLGLRELAMHTFVFPHLGLSLCNEWDLVQVLYGKQGVAWETIAQNAFKHHLELRPLA